MSNYDDTQLENAINTLRSDFDKLVSGDTTTAIKTFNEVIAFLNGISDSESLDNIIASIEQQITNKQDNLVSGVNIKTINGESIVGEGDIKTSGDITEVEKITSKAIASLFARIEGIEFWIANPTIDNLSLKDLTVLNTIEGTSKDSLGARSVENILSKAIANLSSRIEGIEFWIANPTIDCSTVKDLTIINNINNKNLDEKLKQIEDRLSQLENTTV